MSMVQIIISWYKKSDRHNHNDYYLSDYNSLHKSGLYASTSRKKSYICTLCSWKNFSIDVIDCFDKCVNANLYQIWSFLLKFNATGDFSIRCMLISGGRCIPRQIKTNELIEGGSLIIYQPAYCLVIHMNTFGKFFICQPFLLVFPISYLFQWSFIIIWKFLKDCHLFHDNLLNQFCLLSCIRWILVSITILNFKADCRVFIFIEITCAVVVLFVNGLYRHIKRNTAFINMVSGIISKIYQTICSLLQISWRIQNKMSIYILISTGLFFTNSPKSLLITLWIAAFSALMVNVWSSRIAFFLTLCGVTYLPST